MNFSPLLQAPLAIQAHALAAILAFVIGPVIFFRPKGGALHRLLGRVWVLAMAVVIASSFFIFQLRMWGPFSPIHLLSAWSAHALFQGVMLARRGRIAEHRALMKNLYFGALIAAGTFTFLPGRIMNEVLFGRPSATGFYLVLATMILFVLLARLFSRHRSQERDARNSEMIRRTSSG